jgi:hypothetical protein
MDTSVVQPLLQHGVLGIMCVLLIGWIYWKEKQFRQDLADAAATAKADREAADNRQKALQAELGAEQKARVEDAQRFTGLALELQSHAVEACQSLNAHLGENKQLIDGVGRLVRMMQDEDGRG